MYLLIVLRFLVFNQEAFWIIVAAPLSARFIAVEEWAEQENPDSASVKYRSTPLDPDLCIEQCIAVDSCLYQTIILVMLVSFSSSTVMLAWSLDSTHMGNKSNKLYKMPLGTSLKFHCY